MINRNRIVEEFIKYVQIDSETLTEGDFACFIKKELEKLGLKVEIDGAGEVVGSNTGNIIATLEGNREGETIMFSCHMDTVTPGKAIKPIIKDDVIYSDGTTILGGDNKAGIAAIIEAIKVIKSENISHATVQLAFTIAEETGLHGAKNLDYSKIKAKKAFVLDSGGNPGEIIIKGPSQDKIEVKIHGKAAHAGVCPEAGINAIQVAADAIANMNLLRIDEDTTANIGIISGGQATNIVCPEVNVVGEARSTRIEKLDKQTKHMVECFKNAGDKFGVEVEVTTTRMYGPFVIEENDDIVNHAKKACEAIGVTSHTAATGGGSDTNILNCNGIKAINLGIGEKGAHTLGEHLKIEDLVKDAELVLELIKLA